jgi:hypothetical protein
MTRPAKVRGNLVPHVDGGTLRRGASVQPLQQNPERSAAFLSIQQYILFIFNNLLAERVGFAPVLSVGNKELMSVGNKELKGLLLPHDPPDPLENRGGDTY